MKFISVIGLLYIGTSCSSNVSEIIYDQYNLSLFEGRKIIIKNGLIIDEACKTCDISSINIFLDASGSYIGYYEKSNRITPLITNGGIVGFMCGHSRICKIETRELSLTDNYSVSIEGGNVKIYNSNTGELWMEKINKTMNMAGK